jgi:predicted acyltransferase
VTEEARPPEPPPPPAKPPRLVSLDAYRGFVMVLLAASGFSLEAVAKNFKGNPFWDFIGYQFSHCEWRGCTFWDLIQPSFMFMVGVAIPYSYASRKAKGDSDGRILLHTIYRSVVLVLLGVFLMSNYRKTTYWTFVNVLSQIGLGYTFVMLLRGRTFRFQLAALAGILLGTWLLFVAYPAPGPDFKWASVGVPDNFERFTGVAAHFNKNAHIGQRIDLWFLNLFPQDPRFEYNSGGYSTINFIPSMATMLLGLMAGELLRGPRAPMEKFALLVKGGLACLAFGILVDPPLVPFLAKAYSLCPAVKRIWTPSFAVFCSGWTLLMLAGFYWIIDIKGHARWAFFFVVAGMNSTALYCMGMTLKGWVRDTYKIHLGKDLFSGDFGPLFQSAAVMLAFWLVTFWMYRRKIFLKI